MVRISNLQLLKILRENARIPYTEIARILGVSETAIRKRIRKLEKDGVIKKYTIEIDPKKIGYNVTALIGIDTAPEYLFQTIERLKNMDEVISLYSSSGDHMILIEGWFKDSNELSIFIRKLEKMNGVLRICPAIILEKIK
ncbi:MAG TPA: Lrp/AsnC family transcriptional regulator [Thermoprotei archaeon]|nr:Lrp/AsnC family transcriptional regulator [Thermoprotei archaeon]